MKRKVRVLNWGTPSQNVDLLTIDDNGNEKYFKSATNPGELMKYFDQAVEEAKEAVQKDGVNRTVLIRQTILQKNVWVT